MDTKPQTESGNLAVFIALGFIVLLFLGGKWAWNKFEEWRYSKPWFSGTSTQVVCPTAIGKCYNLRVTLNYSDPGEIGVTIHMPNGGYIEASGDCAQAATGVGYDFDRVCTVTDDEDREWDILPAGSKKHGYS